MKFFIKIFLIVAIITPLFAFGQVVSAKTVKEQFDAGLSATAGKTGHTEIEMFKDKSLPEVIGQIIKFALSFLGIFFLGLIIYGGFLWMTDRGNEDQVKKAKNVLQNAVIGLIIVLVAYAITVYILTIIILEV